MASVTVRRREEERERTIIDVHVLRILLLALLLRPSSSVILVHREGLRVLALGPNDLLPQARRNARSRLRLLLLARLGARATRGGGLKELGDWLKAVFVALDRGDAYSRFPAAGGRVQSPCREGRREGGAYLPRSPMSA